MVRRRLEWMFVAALIGSLRITGPTAAQSPDSASGDDEGRQVMMSVNGTPLTVSRFNHSYLQHLLRTGENDTSVNRRAHLDNLVATFLLADEARERGYDDSPEYREHADMELKSAVGGEYFSAALAAALPPLTDEEARIAFRHSKEKVALRQLYFRYPDAAEAALKLLKNGEDFVVLANQVFNTTTYDSSAGYLGYASFWELDDAIAQAAFDLPVGQFSAPVQSRYGWHILRVEDRLTSPIISESEYQRHRSNIEAKARIRRNRLEGDEFIRRMMDSVEVSANREGLLLAVDAINGVLGAREKEPNPPTLTDDEVRLIHESLRPGTLLMTYQLDDGEHEFLARDLQTWLGSLPYSELHDKPLAAIGRALRNEVLAQKGLAAGFESNPDVQETVRFTNDVFLASRLRDDLEPYDPSGISEDMVEKAYNRLGYRTLKSARADWWQISFASMPEADSAKAAIISGQRPPNSFDRFAEFADADLRKADLGGYVRRAPIGRPTLLCASESSCFVLKVDDVRLEYTTLEESEDRIRKQLSERLPEVDLLATLRDRAQIETNAELLETTLDARPSQ